MTDEHTRGSPDEAAQHDRTTGQFTRRTYVKALGAGALAGTFGTIGTASADSHGFDSFVETDGTDLVVDGAPFYFNGTNNFWITHAYEGTQDHIDEVFAAFDDLGINFVRMWANGAGGDKFQSEPGEYDEEHFRVHDYVIQTAAEHGMRVAPCLIDNWEHEGGVLQYAEWAGERNRTHFYTNEEAKDLYKDHVETILTRENYYTGLEWREDPTIAFWELGNELRLEADDPGLDGSSGDVRAENRHREILGDWYDEMSSYFKEVDPNHLVSTGSEGHFYREGESYPNGTWGGQDFVEHHAIDDIDVASTHWYPDHWWCHGDCDDISEVPLEMGPEWIREHVEAAHDELGMPTYLGEFNVRADRPDENIPNLPAGEGHDQSTRQHHLEEWYAAAEEYGINGMAIWQIVLESTGDHDGFQIYPHEASYVETFGEVVAELNGDGTTPVENPCQQVGAQAGAELSNGDWVCDLNGDGNYRDVTASGDTTTQDLQHFFERQHRDPYDSRTDLFDFTGNDDVGQPDVVDLFHSI